MAERTASVTKLETFGDTECNMVVWSGLLNGDTGSAIQMPGSADRSIQITGTFGTGGSITIQGSNNGTDFVALTDPQGNAITKTSAAIEQVSEVTRYIRPSVTAGDGSTSLVVTMLIRRGYR